MYAFNYNAEKQLDLHCALWAAEEWKHMLPQGDTEVLREKWGKKCSCDPFLCDNHCQDVMFFDSDCCLFDSRIILKNPWTDFNETGWEDGEWTKEDLIKICEDLDKVADPGILI